MCACSEETVSLASGRVWIGLWALAARVSQRFMVVSALPGKKKKKKKTDRTVSTSFTPPSHR